MKKTPVAAALRGSIPRRPRFRPPKNYTRQRPSLSASVVVVVLVFCASIDMAGNDSETTGAAQRPPSSASPTL